MEGSEEQPGQETEVPPPIDESNNTVTEPMEPVPVQPDSAPVAQIDTEIAHWTEVVGELNEEYRHLSEQTLDEFHHFMKAKRCLVMDSVVEYASRQVSLPRAVSLPPLPPPCAHCLLSARDLSELSSSVGRHSEVPSRGEIR
jgi:hypothetical protein